MKSYDYRDYVNNSVIHEIVDELIKFPNRSIQVTQSAAGRTWKIFSKEYKEDQKRFSFLQSLINYIFFFFSCLNRDFYQKYKNAIQEINKVSKEIKKVAQTTQKAYLETFSEEVRIEKKEIDLATQLIKTKFENVNKAILAVNEYTNSFRLANILARLFGKFSEVLNKNIVESVTLEKNTLTLILKDDQYRMWVPGKKENDIMEPQGGLVILLSKKIVLDLERNRVIIQEGYKNFVKVPEKWQWAVGEFTIADTTQISELDEGVIRIRVEISYFFTTIKEERDNLHSEMDHEWKTSSEVITGDISNQKVINDHIS